MSKTFTQEQVDAQVQKLIEKEAAKLEKAVAKATKTETTRVLGLVKDATIENKEVESKEIKTHVANVLKALTDSIKEAA